MWVLWVHVHVGHQPIPNIIKTLVSYDHIRRSPFLNFSGPIYQIWSQAWYLHLHFYPQWLIIGSSWETLICHRLDPFPNIDSLTHFYIYCISVLSYRACKFSFLHTSYLLVKFTNLKKDQTSFNFDMMVCYNMLSCIHIFILQACLPAHTYPQTL